jgi:Reverse transcriptase (RNA-dependent DNA polymerase)
MNTLLLSTKVITPRLVHQMVLKRSEHLVFDVKHDGRHRSRLVADGHLTDIPIDSVYSGVVSLWGFRLILFLAELNDLQLWATDIGNAYLEAYNTEKVYIIAGPEFGERQGHNLVISKALYGLRSSGAR